ncbi:MAG: aspartate--tRNA ligase, partial [Deltaproteobacteria bacterium]|nr:aspartate--tRNA ligase [Deltaproteobacteria bacterium]
MGWKERVYCGRIASEDEHRPVLLMGWVDAVRDHGNLLFIHLRDISGIVQVVFDPVIDLRVRRKASLLREEWVVRLKGAVRRREKGTENPNLRTGDLEVFAEELEILSGSGIPPFPISEKAMAKEETPRAIPGQVDEELRLRYRYLDLRRPSMQERLRRRYEILKCIRETLDRWGFLEIETPYLTKSTPEGARDYLVPSRVHRGRFYSLPQSPQIFKQLLMVAGMDRYFQIARCFRDEDLRPNRQPEFTQLDLEASFIDEAFIQEMVEELCVGMFAVGGIDLPTPFPRMPYREALESYGTDRPDLRFAMRFREVTDIVRDTRYGVFKGILKSGGAVKGFCIRGQAGALSKSVLQNEYAMRIAPSFGAGGMTWMKYVGGKLESNIVQFFSPAEQEGLRDRFEAGDGDVLILVADPSRDLVNRILCSLRLHLAERLGLTRDDLFCPLWVTDFPLFEERDGKLGSQHHPFTMPDRTDFD